MTRIRIGNERSFNDSLCCSYIELSPRFSPTWSRRGPGRTMQLPDAKSKSYTERLLDDYEAAGGWINRKVFGLSSFPAMGYGAIAKSAIPVRLIAASSSL
jgi:hypothetical protein